MAVLGVKKEHLDAAFFGVELPEDVPPTQQERAYTSPIWHTP